MAIPFTVEARADTRVNNVMLGMWLLIASEVMLFGGLFSAYVLLRSGAPSWGVDTDVLGLPHGLALTGILLLATLVLRPRNRRALVLSAAIAAGFLVVKTMGYLDLIDAGLTPATSTFVGLYYLLTGMHVLHVAGGAGVAAFLALPGSRSTGGDDARFGNRVRALTLYWYFVDAVWLCIFAAFYLL